MLLFLSGCISYTSITPLQSGRLQHALLDFDGGLGFAFVGHHRIPSGSIRSSPAVLEFSSISTCPRHSCSVMTLNTSQRKLCGCLDHKSKSCQGINVLWPCSSHPTNPPPPKENPCFFHSLPLPGFQQYAGNCMGRVIHQNSLSTISHPLPCLGRAFNFTMTLKRPDAHLSDITFSRVWWTRIWSLGKARNQLCMHLFGVSGICMKLSLQQFSTISTAWGRAWNARAKAMTNS